MICAAICDDNETELETLRGMLYRCGRGLSVTAYADADTLVRDVESGRACYSLYFLDIFLEGMDGVEAARRIRAADRAALIVFISSSEDFYREAYDVFAFNYLVKPVREEAFSKVLDNALVFLRQSAEHSIHFSYRGHSYSLRESDICYISSDNHNAAFHTAEGGIYLYYGKLNDLLPRLRSGLFARCHQSYIVNFMYVTSLGPKGFYVKDALIPISRTYADAAKRMYHNYLFEGL